MLVCVVACVCACVCVCVCVVHTCMYVLRMVSTDKISLFSTNYYYYYYSHHVPIIAVRMGINGAAPLYCAHCRCVFLAAVCLNIDCAHVPLP